MCAHCSKQPLKNKLSSYHTINPLYYNIIIHNGQKHWQYLFLLGVLLLLIVRSILKNTIGIQKLNISIELINGLKFIYHNLVFIKITFYNNKKGPKLALLRLSLRLYIILCWLYIILCWLYIIFVGYIMNTYILYGEELIM